MIRAWLEYLGGSADSPPRPCGNALAFVLGVWWAFLAVVIALFCGQGSKFIYIDF